MQKTELKRIISLGPPSSEQDARTVLSASMSADYRSLRKSYRTLAGEAHPDRFASDASLTALATEAMQIINAAWEILDALNGIGALGQSASQGAPRTSQPRTAPWRASMRSPSNDECDLCGSWPARKMTFRSLTTILIWFSPGKFEGRVCRSCGTALFRNSLRRTMIGSWWGIAVIATPVYFLLLLSNRKKLSSMRPPAFRDINVAAPFHAPVLPPKSPLRSVGPLLATSIALLLFGWLFIAPAFTSESTSSSDSPSTPYTDTPNAPTRTDSEIRLGSCFSDSGDSKVINVDCDAPHDYYVNGLVTDAAQCSSATDSWITAGDRVACLARSS